MLVDKNDSNFSGECLCKTCLFLHNYSETEGKFIAYCGHSKDFVINCGICKCYTERNKE